MHQYTIHVLDGQNHIQQSQDLEALDDIAALEQTKAFVRVNTVEIWDSQGLIARIASNGEALP